MHDNLTDLPEAVPLYRVSPAWRLLAIFAGILALLCLIGVVSLSAVNHGLQVQLAKQPTVYMSPGVAAVPVPVPGPVVVPAVPAVPDKPVGDPANLPYPVREDPRQSIGMGAEPADPQGTPRARFLRVGKEIWRCPPEYSPSQVAVTPDGMYMAFLSGTKLLVGPLNNLREVDELQPRNNNPRVSPPPPPLVRREDQAVSRLIGIPAWSADSRYVYFATAGGRLRRFDTQQQVLETLPFRGTWPAPWQRDANKVIFVRTQPAAKLDAPGMAAGGDLTELVVGDIRAKSVGVLVKAGPGQWRYPTLSPDGLRIAVWTTSGPAGETGPFQLVLISTATGARSPVAGATTATPGPIAWVPGGKAMVYERGLDAPLPSDCLFGEEHAIVNRSAGLFHYDFDQKKETRLTRGGGFVSPSVDEQGNLFYVTWQWQAERGRNTLRLRQASLDQFRDRIAKTTEPPPRDDTLWQALIDQVCTEQQVPADLAAFQPRPDQLARLANSFAVGYQERFKDKPPPDAYALDRMLAEIRELRWPAANRSRLVLVLAAVQGEYLRTRHGAVWHLVEGPLVPGLANAGEMDTPFARTASLIALMERAAGFAADGSSPPLLAELLRRAEGRTIVLTNNPRAAEGHLAEFADADFERGVQLFQTGKNAEAVKVLDAMMRREANRQNVHLALRVGKLFYEHKQLTALEGLMERMADQPPGDPRTFNLLGLALLDRDPRAAANAFKKALRCDLHHGPAYLNLAQAYQRAADTPSAIACLKRYLELLPSGPLAPDATRRLGELEGGN